jgi:hypothetical protein
MLAVPGLEGVKLTEHDAEDPGPLSVHELLPKLPVAVPVAAKFTDPVGVVAVPAFVGLSLTVVVHVEAWFTFTLLGAHVTIVVVGRRFTVTLAAFAVVLGRCPASPL